jgi:N-carbamoyl-L-amino-acid hydrolase
MPKINGPRLIADLRRLAEFGAYKTGVHRPTYTPQDMAARRWLIAKLGEAGLDASLDGIGNILALPRKRGRRLLIGSHSESQNHAGWLDGALGVVFGLEVARAFAEDSSCARYPIEVAAWADEEGHFGNFLGSRSFVGDLGEDEISRVKDHTEGRPLRDWLRDAGLEGLPRPLIKPQEYIGYLEAHIEQGDTLDASGLHIGVVTGIVGIWQYRIVITGEQNHAGTTRMAQRKDAVVALVKLSGAITQRFEAITAPRSVWTTGDIRVEPGQPSIVPGKATMILQIRDVDVAQLQRFEDALRELVAAHDAAGLCSIALELLWKIEPVLMEPSFQDELSRAAERHAPGGWMALPSAAGHDAQVIARKIPAAMLFVPSINGVSHHWTEDTKEEDIVLGCQVLADAAEAIFRRQAL